MTIEAQVKQILTLVTAQTATLTALTEAVANLHEGETDLTPVMEALVTVNGSLAAIRHDLEDDDTPPPAPETSPAP